MGSNGSQNSIQCHSIEYWWMPYKVKPIYVRKLHWMKVWENNDNPCSGVKEKTSENDNEWAWLGSSNSDADSGSYLQSNHFFYVMVWSFVIPFQLNTHFLSCRDTNIGYATAENAIANSEYFFWFLPHFKKTYWDFLIHFYQRSYRPINMKSALLQDFWL